MRETDFARSRPRAATNDGARRRAVMWSAEWTTPVVLRDKATRTHRGDTRHIQRFVGGERRQQARQALRQHALASPGRTHEKQAVGTGSRDQQRALRRGLPTHIRKVQYPRRPAVGAGLTRVAADLCLRSIALFE